MYKEEEDEDFWSENRIKSTIFDDDDDVAAEWVIAEKDAHSKSSLTAAAGGGGGGGRGRRSVTRDLGWNIDEVLAGGDEGDDISQLVGVSGDAVRFTPRPHPGVAAVSSHSPSAPNISSMVQEPRSSRQASTLADPVKLRAEVNMLRRQLQEVRDQSVSDSISSMLHDRPFYLHQYRSKKEKVQLIDEAILCSDGNVITTVVLYVRDTLKPALFRQIILARPVAINHYLSYLKAHHDFDEYTDLLRMVGRGEQAALFHYHCAHSVTDVSSKIRRLKACYASSFQHDSYLTFESSLLQQHISLLELQLPIEAADSGVEKAGTYQLFQKYPRTTTILNMPLITTLYYCCFYHHQLKENSFASPENLKKTFKLNDRQYMWTALMALARLGRWNGIEELFVSRGMFGRRVMKSPIVFSRVVTLLHKHQAPSEVLAMYLRLVDDKEERLNVAKQCKCHEIIVECFMNLRDREQLAAYRSQLTQGTRDWQRADDALRNSSIKWRN